MGFSAMYSGAMKSAAASHWLQRTIVSYCLNASPRLWSIWLALQAAMGCRYGFGEDAYLEAADRGVHFVRWEAGEKPVVEATEEMGDLGEDV